MSELDAYPRRCIEAIAVLRDEDGCTRVVDANDRFQRCIGAIQRVGKLDFVECFINDEDRRRFKMSLARVREGDLDDADDESQAAILRDCETLLLGSSFSNLPMYRRYDWAITKGSEGGLTILSGRRVSTVDDRKKEVEEDLMDYFNKAPIALHWLSATGHILWANQRELEVLGYTPEEYIGHHIMEFCPDSEELVLDIFKELGFGNTIRDVPVRFRTKTGEIRDLLIDSNVRYNTDGSFKHTRCFIRDDSGRMVREARMETARLHAVQTVKDKEAFTRMIFHEILTPCHTSLQCIQCALSDSSRATSSDQRLPEETVTLLTDAEAQIATLLETVNNAEDASRFEQGMAIDLVANPLSLHGAVEEALAAVAAVNPIHPGVECVTTFSEGCPDAVIADNRCLVRIIKNLVGNSAKFTKEGRIEVGVSHECGEVSPDAGMKAYNSQAVRLTFSVVDTGPGVQIEQVNALFQKYWANIHTRGDSPPPPPPLATPAPSQSGTSSNPCLRKTATEASRGVRADDAIDSIDGSSCFIEANVREGLPARSTRIRASGAEDMNHVREEPGGSFPRQGKVAARNDDDYEDAIGNVGSPQVRQAIAPSEMTSSLPTATTARAAEAQGQQFHHLLWPSTRDMRFGADADAASAAGASSGGHPLVSPSCDDFGPKGTWDLSYASDATSNDARLSSHDDRGGRMDDDQDGSRSVASTSKTKNVWQQKDRRYFRNMSPTTTSTSAFTADPGSTEQDDGAIEETGGGLAVAGGGGGLAVASGSTLNCTARRQSRERCSTTRTNTRGSRDSGFSGSTGSDDEPDESVELQQGRRCRGASDSQRAEPTSRGSWTTSVSRQESWTKRGERGAADKRRWAGANKFERTSSLREAAWTEIVARPPKVEDLSSSRGLGLGLNVCYNLVQCMGGTLKVEAGADGKGCCFSFSITVSLCGDQPQPHDESSEADTTSSRWPDVLESKAAKSIVEMPRDLERTPARVPKSLGLNVGVHVLVVDDNTICQKVMCRMLSNMGCTTEVASNGLEVVSKMGSNPSIYSIILMDLRMPMLDGIEATRAIRDLGITHVPIVALSAERGEEIETECKAVGMDDFIHKPCSRDRMAEIFKKLGVLSPSPP